METGTGRSDIRKTARVSAIGYMALLALLALLMLAVKATPIAYAADITSPYTATLKYYDNIQITYTLNHPNGGVWSGSGDIPLGGTGLSSQVYCVDPFVPFHSVADTTWDSASRATLDTMEGYVVAAPWAASAALRQNNDAVRWLILNGYRGDYLADDSESNASVARLNMLYSDIGPIDKRIALMATKVAIWKALAGDNVVILRTSLSPAEKQIFDTLITRMLADAQNGEDTGEKMTEFTIMIDDSSAVLSQPAGSFNYYGPLTVVADLKNSTGDISGLLDKVFLTASGPDSSGVSFVDDDTSGIELPFDALYGTGDYTQYLGNADFANSGGQWTSKKFYLRVPDSRDPDFAEQLTILARAKADDVPLAIGTPVTFVYEDSSVQDWDYVQAFIGAANDGMEAALYSEARLYTKGVPLGSIHVSKYLENASPLDSGIEFTFSLFHSFIDDNFANADLVKLEHYSITAVGAAVDPVTNTFALRNGGSVAIDGLPAQGYYWVIEALPATGYEKPRIDTLVAVGAPMTLTGSSATAAFEMDSGFAAVAFTNIKEVPKAHLYVGKIALELLPNSSDPGFILGTEYHFVLEGSHDGGITWNYVDLTGIFKSDAGQPTFADEGRFTLKTYDMAFIEANPGMTYRVREEDPGPGYTPMYALIRTEEQGVGIWDATESTHLDAPNWGNSGGYYTSEGITASSNGYYWLVFSNLKAARFDLSITKDVVGNATAADRDELFPFQVFYMGGAVPEGVRLSTVPVNNAILVEGIAQGRIKPDTSGNPTVLMLKDGETALIKGLPTGLYKVCESPDPRFVTTYAIGFGTEAAVSSDGGTKTFDLLDDERVAFKNTLPGYNNPGSPGSPGSPGAPGSPGSPNTPGGSAAVNTSYQKGGTPQAGDNTPYFRYIMPLAASALALLGLALSRKARPATG